MENRQKVGEGERDNEGKTRTEFIYSIFLIHYLPLPHQEIAIKDNLNRLLHSLSLFQTTGDIFALDSAIEHCRKQLIAPIEEVTDVWAFGAKKYKAFNWMAGMAWSKPMASIHRHILAIYLTPAEELEKSNKITDPETGISHWAHIICNLEMLKFYTYRYRDLNDLPYASIDFTTKKESTKELNSDDDIPF